jgi:hypothetical protein
VGFLLQSSDAIEKLGKPGVQYLRTTPPLVILCGHHTANDLACVNALGDACPSGDHRMITDCDVLIRANLTGNDHASTNLRSSRKACERRHNGIFAYFTVVTDLNQVVELGTAPDPCYSEASPVDTAIRPDLHIIFDDHASQLQKLDLPPGFIRYKAETVCSDDSAAMNAASRTDFSAIVDRDVRKDHRIVTDANAIAKGYARMKRYAVADDGSAANGHAGMNGTIFTKARVLAKGQIRTDSGWLALRLVKQLNRARERKLRISRDQQSRPVTKPRHLRRVCYLRRDYQSCWSGIVLADQTSGVGDVGHLAGPGLIDWSDPGHLNGCVALELGPYEACKFTKRHGNWQ